MKFACLQENLNQGLKVVSEVSRMFKSITGTWNVFVGCHFECSYCNARKAALTRFRHLARYKDGFAPHIVWDEFRKSFLHPPAAGSLIRTAEAEEDGFTGVIQMFAWMLKAHGGRIRTEPLNKLTVEWIERYD